MVKLHRLRWRASAVTGNSLVIAVLLCCLAPSAYGSFPQKQGADGDARAMVYMTYFLLHDDGKLYDDTLPDLLRFVQNVQKSPTRGENTAWLVDFLAGEIARRGKDFEAAEASFNKSISADRSNALPWLALSEIQIEKGDMEKGLANLRNAAVLITKSIPDEFQHLCFEQVGAAYEKVGRYTEAIGFYRAALRKKSDWGSGLAALAAAYLSVNQPEKALPSLQKAIVLEPKEPRYYALMAEAQRSLGQAGPALQSLKKATELDPGNALYHYGLGLQYEMKGDKEAALNSYSAALNIAEKNEQFSNLVPDLRNAIKRVGQ